MTEHKDKTVTNDSVGKFLVGHLRNMLFDELSDEYLKKAEMYDILKGVAIPFKPEELTHGDMTTLMLASNMAYVLGCDSGFKYRDSYLAFIKKCFPHDFDKPMLNEGVKAAQADDPETACIYFRAALILDPESQDGMFLYGRALKDSYEKSDDEEYIGTFKAEALRMFEKVTIKYPEFDQAYYFLGYQYLNLGLYIKSKLTFEEYMKLSKDEDIKKEVGRVLEDLAEPCRIEDGMNDVTSGRYDSGISKLEAFAGDGRFRTYWPLYYYLGVAYKETGDHIEAEKMFLDALKASPSNTDVMKELIDIYEDAGNEELASKYREKIKRVELNMELDKEEKNKGDYS